MARPDTTIIEGRAYSWRAILEARRAQLEAWRKAQGAHSALFPHTRADPAFEFHVIGGSSYSPHTRGLPALARAERQTC
jgi:hypothetical protein